MVTAVPSQPVVGNVGRLQAGFGVAHAFVWPPVVRVVSNFWQALQLVELGNWAFPMSTSARTAKESLAVEPSATRTSRTTMMVGFTTIREKEFDGIPFMIFSLILIVA
jgi:hypothetical protein